MRTERLQALADGIFAIALTLLVLGLPTPKDSHRLGHDLLAQWPAYAAYVMSFVTVGIVWINHHRLMDCVARADRTLLELNLLLLLFVTVVPWPTGLLADYIRDEKQSPAAAVTYGLVMFLMGSSFTVVWLWLDRRRDLVHPHTVAALRPALRRSALGAGTYAVSVLVALVDARVAFLLFALVAGFFAVSGRRTAPSDVRGVRG